MPITPYSKPFLPSAKEQYVPFPIESLTAYGQSLENRELQRQKLEDEFGAAIGSIKAIPQDTSIKRELLNEYQSKLAPLAEEYKNKLYDPEFARKQKKTITELSRDPRISFLTDRYQKYQDFTKQKQEADIRGLKYISPQIQESKGINPGEYSPIPESIKKITAFEDLEKDIEGAANSMTYQDRYLKSNRQALNTLYKDYFQGVRKDVPEQIIEYNMSLGMNKSDATRAADNYIKSQIGKYVKEDIDSGLMSLDYQKRQASMKAQEQQPSSLPTLEKDLTHLEAKEGTIMLNFRDNNIKIPIAGKTSIKPLDKDRIVSKGDVPITFNSPHTIIGDSEGDTHYDKGEIKNKQFNLYNAKLDDSYVAYIYKDNKNIDRLVTTGDVYGSIPNTSINTEPKILYQENGIWKAKNPNIENDIGTTIKNVKSLVERGGKTGRQVIVDKDNNAYLVYPVGVDVYSGAMNKDGERSENKFMVFQDENRSLVSIGDDYSLNRKQRNWLDGSIKDEAVSHFYKAAIETGILSKDETDPSVINNAIDHVYKKIKAADLYDQERAKRKTQEVE